MTWPHGPWPVHGGRWNRPIPLCCSVSSGQLPSQLAPQEHSQAPNPQAPLSCVCQGLGTLGLSSELSGDVQAGVGLQALVCSQVTRMEEESHSPDTGSGSLLVQE